jgi:hypothetical protein
MDEIRAIEHEGDRGIYRMRIYSDRLKTLSRECPDDARIIYGTGDMYLGKENDWYVEYHCPIHGDIKIWTSDIDTVTRQIAADVLGEAGANSASKL